MMQVSPEITREGILFLGAVASGAVLILVYDVLRILRQLLKHKQWVVAGEDILYWIGCALFVFIMLCKENDGMMRGFILLGLTIGMLLYNQLLSRRIVPYVVRLIRFLCRIIGRPLKFCVRLLLRPIRFLSRYIKRVFRKIRKCLKKLYRTVKMALCKL